jgi:hypothetical protein
MGTAHWQNHSRGLPNCCGWAHVSPSFREENLCYCLPSGLGVNAYLCCRWDVAVEYIPEDDGVDPPMPESPRGDEQSEEQQQQQQP